MDAIEINGTTIPVTVDSADLDNDIITLGVDFQGQQVHWTLRKLFDEDGTFYLQMTLNDGTQDTLSFVRKNLP